MDKKHRCDHWNDPECPYNGCEHKRPHLLPPPNEGAMVLERACTCLNNEKLVMVTKCVEIVEA